LESLQLDSTVVIGIGIALLAAVAFGWFLASIRYRGEIFGLREVLENTRRDVFDQLPQSVEASLNNITANALARNNENFLDLAAERMHRQQSHSDASLAVRERAVDAMLDPIRDSLELTQRELRRLEQDRINARSSLNQHLGDLVDAQRILQQETQGLAQALRRPEVRGRWGELTLRRLVELSGLSSQCDFTEQVSVNVEGNLHRPDLIVHLPGDRIVVVDAKTPLDAFLAASTKSSDAERDAAMERHASLLKSRIRELASKKYWDSFEQSLDFVIIFLPGDQFLASALEHDSELLEYALAKKVIPATPTSLIAVLRALAASWRQQKLTENAAELARCGDQLLEKLNSVNALLGQLGRGLDGCMRDYQRLTAHYGRDVLPAVERMQELGLRRPEESRTPGSGPSNRTPAAIVNHDQIPDAAGSLQPQDSDTSVTPAPCGQSVNPGDKRT